MAASTSTEVTLVTLRLSKVGLHHHLVHGRRHGRVTRATAQQHRALGVQPSRSFFLPAWYSGLLLPAGPGQKAGLEQRVTGLVRRAARQVARRDQGRGIGQRGVGQQVFRWKLA